MSFSQGFFDKLKKFISALNKKATFVLTSADSGKKSWFQTMRFRTSLIIVIIVLLLTASAVNFYLNKDEKKEKIEKLTQENENRQKRLVKMEAQIGKINKYHKAYNQEINQIFQYFGNIEEKTLWSEDLISSKEELEVVEDVSLETVADPKIMDLNKNRVELMVTLKHLEDIGKYIDLRELLINHIPIGWPIYQNRGYKTSGYGPRLSPFSYRREFHTGVDIAASSGTHVLATAAGIVIVASSKKDYGQMIIIRHKFNYRTVYSHNKKNLVKVGDLVKKNQPIAIVGSTGRSTGPHLHYEVRIGRQHVDPWDYLITKF